jgi:hypothetical protein
VRATGDLGEEILDKLAHAETRWLADGLQWRQGPLAVHREREPEWIWFAMQIRPGLPAGYDPQRTKRISFYLCIFHTTQKW